VYIVALCLGGCSSSARTGVEGTVTFAGEAIAVGTITFVPIGEKGIKCGARIEKGRYHVEPQFGPVPGPHRVEIRWARPTGKKYKNEYGEVFDVTEEGLPGKYHEKSILTATIKSGKNVINFDLEP
jgi:hypothetical protein